MDRALCSIAATPEEFPFGARGKRPVSFTLYNQEDVEMFYKLRAFDGEGLPGIIIKGARVETTFDGALVVCELLGEPTALDDEIAAREKAPVPMPGMEQYKKLNLKLKRRDYQGSGASWLLRRSYAILGDHARCLSGDTVVDVTLYDKRQTACTIKDLYLAFNKLKGRVFDFQFPIKLQSAKEDGYLCANEIEAVYASGKKEVFLLKTALGRAIKASADHKFKTASGWKKLSELRVHDEVYVAEARKMVELQPRDVMVLSLLRRGMPREKLEPLVTQMSADAHAILQKMKDMPGHFAERATKLDKIVSIESAGVEETYDISMKAPLHNFVANDFVVHNSGKCLSLLLIAALLGSKRVVVCCNALGKYVWGDEVATWLGEKSALLFGRGSDDLRVICVDCKGHGDVETNEKDEDGQPVNAACKACDGKGEFCYEARKLEPETVSEVYHLDTGKKKKDGANRMQRYVATASIWPAKYVCSKHVTEADVVPRYCTQCKAELFAALAECRFVVVNYDLLLPQKMKTGRGVGYIREDLPGWGATLAQLQFDMAILSEAHRLRGWDPKTAKKGDSRRDRVKRLCEPIPRVIAETGTPTCGFCRDYWSILDIISNGLWS